MLKKILLPFDGTACGRKAVDWALSSLDKTQSELYLLMVIDMTRAVSGAEVPCLGAEHELEDAENRSVTELRDEFAQAGFTVAEARSVFGLPADSICTFARSRHIEQIIMNSHHRHGFGRWLIGSTSEEVAKNAGCEVLILEDKPV